MATVVRDFTAVHERLKGILEPLRGRLVVTKDGPNGMALEIAGLEGKPWGYVAATRLGKSYVSFYLQGKACFNFTKIDEPLMQELGALLAASLDRYRETAAVRAGTGWKAG